MIERPYWGDPKIKYPIDLSKNVHYDSILQDKFKQLLSDFKFNLCTYPDDYVLYKTLSNYYNIPINQLSLGFGATEIIERVLRALDIKKLYILDPMFEMLPVYCSNNNIRYTVINSLSEAIDSNSSIYIVNPNGNDGTILDLSNIHNKFQYCIVDEVYADFNNMFSLLDYNYSNVVVIKSLSKSLGIAGLRVGFCKASSNITKQIQLLRHSYMSASLSEYIVPLIINETPSVISRMIISKEYIMSLFDCVESNGNYVLFKEPNILTETFGCKLVNNMYRMALADKETILDVINNQSA